MHTGRDIATSCDRTCISACAKNRSTHVCICFVAYKIYKELERIIKEKNIDLSVGKVLDAVKTITTIRVQMSENEEIYTKTLVLTDKHRAIRSLFDFADEPK